MLVLRDAERRATAEVAVGAPRALALAARVVPAQPLLALALALAGSADVGRGRPAAARTGTELRRAGGAARLRRRTRSRRDGHGARAQRSAHQEHTRTTRQSRDHPLQRAPHDRG